jgi:hypothetical protein
MYILQLIMEIKVPIKLLVLIEPQHRPKLRLKTKPKPVLIGD